jgi:hypothetical protein
MAKPVNIPDQYKRVVSPKKEKNGFGTPIFSRSSMAAQIPKAVLKLP